MDRNDPRYRDYLAVLERELVPAMGCTEPIAIAYTAALARRVLERPAQRVLVSASGNIIKNVKSVVVPNTGGKKGIAVAAAVGVVAGDPDRGLEVISDVTPEQLEQLERFLAAVPIEVAHAQGENALEVTVTLFADPHYAKVQVVKEHSNVVLIERDGQCLYERGGQAALVYDACYESLSMEGLYDFALTAEIADVQELLERQIAYNSAIAREGLEHPYGAAISSTLLSIYGSSLPVRAKAMAAAGSDARMSGCELPVVINSGSGNQGMTASLPVIEYARELQVSREQLYRALLLSNLSTIYQKIHIGRLSAYCGAVSAGAGAGAGIAYLLGGGFDHVCHTIVNALAITSGIICDGAKPSCAAKIAAAVEAGILGCQMYLRGKQFTCGEGIVCRDIEETIKEVGHLAREGMKETDQEIITMMMRGETVLPRADAVGTGR